jgi:hypothetical protein
LRDTIFEFSNALLLLAKALPLFFEPLLEPLDDLVWRVTQPGPMRNFAWSNLAPGESYYDDDRVGIRWRPGSGKPVRDHALEQFARLGCWWPKPR